MKARLTIGQVAAAAGLSPDTLRYYERAGVLPPVPRGANSYRRYPPEHVETLRFARRLRELGLSQAGMADLVRLFHDGTCREMREALMAHCEATLDRVRARLRELERVEAQLAAVLAGLQQLDVDNHQLSTVEPCSCVAIVEGEEIR